MADYPTKQFFGAAQTVINTGTDIATLTFSGAPAATFTNNDGGTNCVVKITPFSYGVTV